MKFPINRHLGFMILVCTIALTTLGGCNRGPQDPISRSSLEWLGTTSTITLYDSQNQNIITKAFQRVEEIHKRMSLQLPTSELSHINRNAGIGPVRVSSDTFFVVEEAPRIARETGGAFDPTVGPLVDLWDITGNAYLPTQEEIQEILPLIDYRVVEINRENLSVFLPIPGMKLDLGGIAKGYAADEAARILIENGVRKAIIDFGGDIIALGTRVTGEPWRIGIQNPFTQRGSFTGIYYAEDKTIVTSGTYERYLMHEGVRYHHLFDTTTGFPGQNGVESVTIMASGSSSLADAYSTAAFIMGLEAGLSYVESIPGVEALFIMDDLSLHATSGILKGGQEIFRLIDQNFHFAPAKD